MGNHNDPRDEESCPEPRYTSVTVSPLDEYKQHRKESERKLKQLTTYRDSCRARVEGAKREFDEVDAAIAELETLLKPKKQPEGSR